MKKRLINLYFFSLIALPALAQVPSYVPTNGLIGWWPFNGNANDESGNGNNGTVNGATLSTDRFGVENKAYSFDGVDDFISTYRPGYNSFTVSIWYKINSVAVISPLIDGFDSYYDLYFYQNSLRYATFSGINQYLDIICNLNLEMEIWKNIVVTYENNIIWVYSNGNMIDQYSVLPLSGYAGNHNFGASLTGSDQFLFGSLDDIGIWDRALTETEIAELYNACSNSLSAQPTDQSIELSAGNTAQFSVTSSAITASYQWQTDLGLGFQNLSDAGQYSGSTTNTLSVNNVTLANNNQQFRCIVADGSCEDTTDVAVLTVIDDLGIEYLNANGSKKLLKITDLNGKETSFRKNTVLLFIYEDGTVERVYEAE